MDVEALDVLQNCSRPSAFAAGCGRALRRPSIATIYAGSHQDHRVQGLALIGRISSSRTFR